MPRNELKKVTIDLHTYKTMFQLQVGNMNWFPCQYFINRNAIIQTPTNYITRCSILGCNYDRGCWDDGWV